MNRTQWILIVVLLAQVGLIALVRSPFSNASATVLGAPSKTVLSSVPSAPASSAAPATPAATSSQAASVRAARFSGRAFIVSEHRSKPTLYSLDGHALARGIVLDLVTPDLTDGKV